MPSTSPPPLLPAAPTLTKPHIPPAHHPSFKSEKTLSPPLMPPHLEKMRTDPPVRFSIEDESNSPKPSPKPAPPGATVCKHLSLLDEFELSADGSTRELYLILYCFHTTIKMFLSMLKVIGVSHKRWIMKSLFIIY